MQEFHLLDAVWFDFGCLLRILFFERFEFSIFPCDNSHDENVVLPIFFWRVSFYLTMKFQLFKGIMGQTIISFTHVLILFPPSFGFTCRNFLLPNILFLNRFDWYWMIRILPLSALFKALMLDYWLINWLYFNFLLLYWKLANAILLLKEPFQKNWFGWVRKKVFLTGKAIRGFIWLHYGRYFTFCLLHLLNYYNIGNQDKPNKRILSEIIS